jgi:hypothetical protein
MDKIQLPDGSLVSIEQAQSLFNDQYQTFIDDGTLKIVSEEQMSNNIFISPDGSEMTEKQARDLYKKQFQSFVNDGTLKKKGDTPSDGQEEVTESITETETIPGSSDSSQQNDEQPAGFSTANDLRRNRYNRERGLGRQIYESEVEIGTPEAMQKQAEAVKEAATVKVEETEEVEEVDYTAEIDAENEVIIQYRNQIKIHEEETQAYLNDNPNLTGDEKYAWVNRDSEKWTPIYEAVEAADLAKEDLLYAGYKTKALEDSGYLEGIEKYRNITDNIDYEKEGINRNIIPEKQYMLTDEVTGKLKPVKESDVNPELLESIKLYEVASIDVSPNYDDVDLDEGEVSNFDEFLGNIIIKDGSDVADYLKWEKKNTRNETAVYKWMKPLLTNDEGDEFFKQKKYYEKVQSYKASQLNEISNRLDQIKAKINLTSDPKLVKILKNEAKELTKEFLAKAASISTTIKDFPIFKKYTDDADLRRRKAMYEASQDGPVSSGGQGLVELLSTTVNTGAGFSLDFLSAIPAFFDQRISTIGEGDDKFDNKGFLKGLEEMFSDRKVSLDAAIGAVSRPAFFDGKPVTSMGKQYLVDENGTVYDANTNIRMDGIISDEKIKEIQTLSKDVTETVTSWTAGSVTQGGVGVIVNLYALIRTSLKVTKGLGLKGPKGSAIGMGITSFGTGVTSNVEDVRSQLVASGMSEKEAIDIAVNAGQAIATLDGIFSGLAGGNQNLLVGLQGIKDQIKNLAIKKGKDFTVKQLVDKGKTLAKENFKEVVIEEIPVYASTQGINHLVNTHIGNEVLNDKITKAGLMETVVMTVGATSGLGARKLLSGNKRSDLVRLAAANVKDLQPTLDVLIKEGSLTEKEASDAYTEIYNMQSAELKTQGTIKVSENLQPASDLLTQRQNLINQKQGLEGPGKARIDKQIAAVDQQLDALYKKDELDVEAIMNSEKEGTVTVTVTKEEALASLRGKNQEANESGISKVAETEENILKEQERLIKERGNPITPTKEASTENKVPKDRLGEAHTDKRLITPSNPKGEANISNVTSLDKEGVSTATYVNPETGSVDAIISSKDKKNFVGYVRVYENGKPTNKFSAKMESTGGAFKNMITSADATLPDGARVIETTTISEGGLKSFNKSNLDVETDADGNVVTNTTKYSDATKQSVEEKGENAYNPFRTDDKAKAEAEVEKIKKAYPGIEVKIKRQGTKRGKKTYTIDIELPVLIKKGKDAISKPSTKEQVLPDAPTSKEGGKESQVELRQVGKGNVEQVTPDTKIEEGETQTDKPSDTTTKTNAEQVEYNEILELEREQEALEQEMDKEPGFLRSVKGMLNDFKGEKSNKKFQETYDRSEKLSQEINDRRNALYNKNSTPADNLKRQKLFDKSKLAFDTYIKSKENFDKIENPTKEDRAEIDRLSEKFRNESQSLANFTESVILRGIPTKIDTTSDTTTEGDVEQVTQPTSTEEGMSVNKDSETKKESEGVSKLRDALRKSGTTVKRNTAKQISKLGKQIENAKKALSKILPDVEIIMPSSEAEYKRLTGESKNQNSGGTYIDGKIYINPNRASSRVVSHEVFHAVLLSKGMSEAQAKAITERMLSAVKKSASKEILDKIDKFSKRYPEALQSEESIAELLGILASEYDTLPKPSQNIVKRWLDKLAKIFGIKPFTDVEVVDLLNTLASKVESGQEVSAKDVKILKGKDSKQKTEARKSSSKPTIEEIVSKGKEIGSSDADIREVAQQEGYANKDTNSEIEKYDTKKREAAQKAEKLFVKGGKIAKSLDFLRRWALSARGFLPKSMQIGKEVLTGAVAANAKQAENNLKDLQKYIKKQKKSVQDKLVQDLNSYMRGDADIDTLPAKLRPIAYAMRTHIDSLSMSLVESGAITDIKFDELSPKQKKELIKEFGTEAEARKNYKSQKDNIIDNLGSYLNRSFEVFDNKNYSPSDAVLNAAKEKLREQYAEAAKEKALEENNDVDAVLEEMVDNALEKILSREEGREFLNSSKLGSKNISVLKEKIDIPAEIRALMGEYTDPALNYVRSVNKIAALVANQEFLSEMKKAGEGVFFFNKPTGEYNQLIAPKGSDTYNPLNGMYTTKAIRDTVLNTPGFKINDKTIAFLLNWYYGMVGSVKYAKTILSPATHAKNVIGNLFFMAYNGYANPKVYFAAADVVMSDLRGRDKNNNREKMQEYIRLGIINQSANLGEIRSLLKSKGSLEDLMSKRNKADKTPLKRLKRFFKRTGKIAEDAYQAEDDVFKIISFEMEKKRYSKALFNKTFDKLSSEQQKEVTDRVTEIVKNILPNYSRIGGIGKLMKAVPIAGTFISFQIEAMRTAWNVAQLALSEIQNKKTAAIGAKRIAGITAVTAVKAAILPMFGVVGQAGIEAIKDALGNEDDEDDEDEQKEKDVINNSARDFIHPWAENANVIITKLDNGKFNYINFSASDPHGFVDKAIISAFRGETAAEGMENAFTSLIKPFMTKDILFKSITSIETDYGKEIYNETDTPNELAKKFGDIVYKTFEPGGVTSARKLFKAFEDEDKSLLNEIIGQATGFKVHTVDFEKQLLFKSLDLRKRADKASKDYSKAYYERKKKDISVDDLEKRYDVANDKYKQILKDGVRFYSSSLKLGSSRFKSYKSMYGYKKLSRYEMSYIRNGNIPELKKKKTDKYKLK